MKHWKCFGILGSFFEGGRDFFFEDSSDSTAFVMTADSPRYQRFCWMLRISYGCYTSSFPSVSELGNEPSSVNVTNKDCHWYFIIQSILFLRSPPPPHPPNPPPTLSLSLNSGSRGGNLHTDTVERHNSNFRAQVPSEC